MIEILQSVRERKEMYFQPISVEAANNFLGGIWVTCFAFGVCTHEDWDAAIKLRGWEVLSIGPTREMRVRGLSEEQMIDELIEIQIAALRLAAARG